MRKSGENMERGDRIRLTGLNTTRQRRTLDERIFVRFPALARRFLYLWSRLPKGSRLRRLLLVRSMGQGVCATNRRDFDVLLLALDPEIDYRAVSVGPGGAVAPDLVGHHHGHRAYVRLWEVMIEAIADFQLRHEEVIDLGDRLLAAGRYSGHGTSSGVPFDQPVFQVFTLRRGLVVKQEDFASEAEALEAVGLR